MTPFMQLLLVMALLIGGAKLAAIFSLRLGRPTLFGALIFGLLLGPSLLDIFGRGWFEPEVTQTVVSTMASLGALFIMAQLGLLCDWEVLRSPNRTVLLVGVFSTLIPLLLGILITRLYSVSTTNAIWIGVVLAATSINVISQMLQAYGKFEGTVGTTILGAATVGSILSVILFTLCMALLPAESIGLAARTFVQLLVFLVGITLLGIWLLPRLFARAERLPIAYPTPTIALIVLLLLAWSSEQIGLMSAASGAFLAGLLFRHIDQRALIADGLELLSITVFVPLFYISIGLSVNLRQLLVGDFLGIAVLLCVLAVVSGVVGAGLGAWLGKMPRRDALRVGAGMVSRGELSIIAAMGITQSQMDELPHLLAATTLMVLLSLLVGPRLMRWAFQEKPQYDWQPAQPSGDTADQASAEAAALEEPLPEEEELSTTSHEFWKRRKPDTQPLPQLDDEQKP